MSDTPFNTDHAYVDESKAVRGGDTVSELTEPTDEEREEIVRIIGSHVDLPMSSRLVIAQSILGNGFRRPAQGEAAKHSLNNYADDRQVQLLRLFKAGAWEFVPNQEDKP